MGNCLSFLKNCRLFGNVKRRNLNNSRIRKSEIFLTTKSGNFTNKLTVIDNKKAEGTVTEVQGTVVDNKNEQGTVDAIQGTVVDNKKAEGTVTEVKKYNTVSEEDLNENCETALESSEGRVANQLYDHKSFKICKLVLYNLPFSFWIPTNRYFGQQ